jgi:hypothetical protein
MEKNYDRVTQRRKDKKKEAILISPRHCTCHRMSLKCINFNETSSSNDVCHRKADIMETSFMLLGRTFYFITTHL